MASIDDVDREMNMLLDALFRTPPDGITGGMGQVGSFPGLASKTYRLAQATRNASLEVVAVVQETSALLKAVNVETLGRVEDRINANEQTLGRLEVAVNDGRANSDQTFGRIESDLKQVMEFLPTLREDMTDLRASLDAIVVGLQQDRTDLNAALAALKADIQALPH